jgi:hypothetical protein
VLRCLIWVFFAAGIARIVSIAVHGLPSTPVLGLLASEILAPPCVAWWLSQVEREEVGD